MANSKKIPEPWLSFLKALDAAAEPSGKLPPLRVFEGSVPQRRAIASNALII